jgi:UDP-N-acetyl-D-mannosaminuronic acid dehydrogenase
MRPHTLGRTALRPYWAGGDVKRNIVVIGMGYVGIPAAALLADVPGHNVIGVQRRSRRSGWKIDWINSGKNPFEGDEPGMDELIARVVLEKKTFRVTDDFAVCRDADVILIDVQTPTNTERIPEYLSLRTVSAQAASTLQPGTLVIIESTVAPGTTEQVVKPILEEGSGLQAGEDFYLAFSYERVMPGKLLKYITDFPRVVGGIDGESTRRAVELYKTIVREEITPTSVLTAELAKTMENAYRDVNIAFANEMARMCEAMGVDVYEIQRLMNARHDRHMHLAGAGVGGHCLPKDSWLLKFGVDTYGAYPVPIKMIALAREINDGMPLHLADMTFQALTEQGVDLDGAKIAVLGVAYLEDSDDTRNTPAIVVIEALQEKCGSVAAHDPYVRELDGYELTRDLEMALRGADAAVIVTKHRPYYDLDLSWLKETMRTPILVDGRNVFDAGTARAAGFTYRAIGKG